MIVKVSIDAGVEGDLHVLQKLSENTYRFEVGEDVLEGDLITAVESSDPDGLLVDLVVNEWGENGNSLYDAVPVTVSVDPAHLTVTYL